MRLSWSIASGGSGVLPIAIGTKLPLKSLRKTWGFFSLMLAGLLDLWSILEVKIIFRLHPPICSCQEILFPHPFLICLQTYFPIKSERESWLTSSFDLRFFELRWSTRKLIRNFEDRPQEIQEAGLHNCFAGPIHFARNPEKSYCQFHSL